MDTVMPDRGGWISGPELAPEDLERDRRPEYSPLTVVLDVRAALAQSGIILGDLGPAQRRVATTAAAQLLQAIGVRPSTIDRTRS